MSMVATQLLLISLFCGVWSIERGASTPWNMEHEAAYNSLNKFKLSRGPYKI